MLLKFRIGNKEVDFEFKKNFFENFKLIDKNEFLNKIYEIRNTVVTRKIVIDDFIEIIKSIENDIFYYHLDIEIEEFYKFLHEFFTCVDEVFLSSKSDKEDFKKYHISYDDRPYLEKRKILRQYSIKPEIKNYLDIITDYVVDYIKTKSEYINISNIVNENILYRCVLNLLIDGYVSYEIVYDDQGYKPIDIIPIDPLTLIRTEKEWIQHPDNPTSKRILFDNQIIYMSYFFIFDIHSSTSYVEELIRPYNQYNMIVDSMVMYSIKRSEIRKVFKIPVDGLTRQQAEQQIHNLIESYNEDISFDEKTGILYKNKNSNTITDYWFPSNSTNNVGTEFLSPEISNGHNLLEWFKNNLDNASRIPKSILYDDISSEGKSFERFNSYVSKIGSFVLNDLKKINK